MLLSAIPQFKPISEQEIDSAPYRGLMDGENSPTGDHKALSNINITPVYFVMLGTLIFGKLSDEDNI